MRGYYCTMRTAAGRTAFLLGPFERHEDAESAVPVARGLAVAVAVDPMNHFHGFGTASIVKTAAAITVHEFSEEGQPIGLLDASGRPIYRVEIRRPIGFVHFCKPRADGQRS